MAGPVSRETFTPSRTDTEVCVDAGTTSETSASTSAPPPADAGAPNSIEPYASGTHEVSSHGPHDEGPTVSPQQLQAQAAADEAKNRKVLENAIDSVMPQLQKAAAQYGKSGFSVAALEFAAKVSRTPEFKAALQTLPREQMEKAIELVVRCSMPRASAADLKTVTARLVGEVQTGVLTDTARRMSDGVSKQLNGAAATFEKTANDPAELAKMTQTLTRLDSSTATPEQRKRAEALRGALGLPDDVRQVTPDALKKALLGRAGLMRQEATHMQNSGESTLYRKLLLHSAMGEKMVRDAGIAPGSWASQGARMVKGRGEADEQDLATAKVVTSLALAVTSMGLNAGIGSALSMGARVGLSAGMTAALNAPEVMSRFEEIQDAAAGASAGTADVNAVAQATNNARWAAAEAIVSVALSGAGGAHAASIEELAKHAGKDVVKEVANMSTFAAAAHLTRPADGGSEGDAVSRALAE